MSQNKYKIVEYYKPADERLPDQYFAHLKLLGLDKHPYGMDQEGVLRFEVKDTGSRIWQAYRKDGGLSQDEITEDSNEETLRDASSNVILGMDRGEYTTDEVMQFFREDGTSLRYMIDQFSTRYYLVENVASFQRALDKLSKSSSEEEARQSILDTIFLAHLDSVEDELIFKYRLEAKKIINENFGPNAFSEFIKAIKENRVNGK